MAARACRSSSTSWARSAPEAVAEAATEGGKPLPSLHSRLYYPVPEPTIKTGVLTMSMAVLNLMGK